MKNRTAGISFIYITILIDVIGIGIIIPILPSLLETTLGVETSKAAIYGGGLLVAYGLFQFLCSPILGRISDRYGRRPVLLISLLGLGLDYLLLATTSSYTVFLIGRIIAGICGASFSTANAYIADVSLPQNRARNFGMVGAMFGIGFIIGPALGGLLSERIGIHGPFYVSAALSLINFLYGLLVLPESLPKERRRDFKLKDANPIKTLEFFGRHTMVRKLVPTFALLLVAGQAIQGIWSYFVKERYGWDDGEIGLSLAIVGLVVGIIQGGVTGRVVKKYGLVKTIFIGLVFNGTGLFLFGLATEGWMVLTILVPYALGGIAGPALQSILSNAVPDNEQGELQGSLVSLQSASGLLGIGIMFGIFALFTNGWVADIYLPGAHLFLASILIGVAGLLAYPVLKDYKLPEEDAHELATPPPAATPGVPPVEVPAEE